MRRPRWTTTPLVGTAAVMAALALIAIPLHRLTSAHQVVAAASQPTKTDRDNPTTEAVFYLRLLAPAQEIAIRTPNGEPIWKLGETPAGEYDHDAAIALAKGQTELVIEAQMTNPNSETAVFLTIMPNGLAEQTRHTIGSGEIHETLRFTWPEP